MNGYEYVGDDAIVIDHDPPPDGRGPDRPVIVRLDGVPPKAQSKGWGDMSWLNNRRA